jgi:hypothetical protein
VGRYESTGGWCWAAAKMRTATPWFVRFVGKIPPCERIVSIFAESQFLRPVANKERERRVLQKTESSLFFRKMVSGGLGVPIIAYTCGAPRPRVRAPSTHNW